ncbi:MAG: four helix bundle protein [Chitinophagaceae bacterium]|nr:MAG: four helix bundle protein [Chitinophagaceae bacterium]
MGALIRGSGHAESKADFIHKLSIGLKEANESDYWLDLLKDTGYISQSEHHNLKDGLNE